MRSRDTRQALVDRVFAQCMARDERTLERIRQQVRIAAYEHRNINLSAWRPTDHELQIMISRNCMGEGEWEYFPAYSNPPRYVSRERVRRLCALAEQGCLTERERAQLREQLEDLNNGIAHWRAKHRRARQKEAELLALVDDISLKAFAGHYSELV
jgi:hypothetical protein